MREETKRKLQKIMMDKTAKAMMTSDIIVGLMICEIRKQRKNYEKIIEERKLQEGKYLNYNSSIEKCMIVTNYYEEIFNGEDFA